MTGTAIQGTPPFKYVVEGLTAGTTYYVRVAARNSVAPQPVNPTGSPPDNTNWSGTLSAKPQDRVPTAPVWVALAVRSGTSLAVTVKRPADDGGPAVTHYKFEWATDRAGAWTHAPTTTPSTPSLGWSWLFSGTARATDPLGARSEAQW